MVDTIQFYPRKPSRYRGVLNGIFALILFLFVFLEKKNSRTLVFAKPPPLNPVPVEDLESHIQVDVIRRKMTQVDVNSSKGSMEMKTNFGSNPTVCTDIYEHKGYKSKCHYLISNPECSSNGYFSYLEFFYCDCENYKLFGYIVLVLWLVALFYFLGNTATDYFCCSLEKLSELLKLAPTVAGVTLLPLGNGAPDVFASIATFVGHDKGDVGLNSVLGGALFVTCIVVGAVSLSVSDKNVKIRKRCFIRDICFLLITLSCVLIILIVGEVSVWGAVAYLSIYVVYALSVAASEIFMTQMQRLKTGLVSPLIPIKEYEEEDKSMHASLFQFGTDADCRSPNWVWASKGAMSSNENIDGTYEEIPNSLWGWNDGDPANDNSLRGWSKFCMFLGLPLILTRRLTIPIVDKERWSKGYAVASASLAPLLVAFVCNMPHILDPQNGLILYVIGGLVGGLLGILTMIFTEHKKPPQRCLFAWVLGGFFMCVIWFYIIANELVSLLVSIGLIFGINPSILGLTVLAWGNSMGDLFSNFALAMKGRDGIQIAMSGCYAGPMFNTLAGLGISMLLGAWSKRPVSYIVPEDTSLFSTIGFLMLGLVWSLVVLPRNKMFPNKTLGIGLVAIYLAFLAFRLCVAMGILSNHGLR